MEKIGENLRRRRLEKDISLEEIEKATKIRRRYLEAMENEEWSVFPGIVYLKGFLKTYCRYLDLNETQFISAIEELIVPAQKPEPLPEKIEISGKPHHKMTIILGVIAILLLISCQYVYTNYINKPIPSSVNPPVQEEDTNQDNLAEQTPGEEPNMDNNNPQSSESITLRINCLDNKCWVIVKTGNEKLYEGILNKGEEKIFSDLKQVYFGLGNSGDVEVYLNDKSLGILGAVREVVYKEYILENNEIKEIKVVNKKKTDAVQSNAEQTHGEEMNTDNKNEEVQNNESDEDNL